MLQNVFKQGTFNLIVKGKPGSGKTIFTLSILKKAKSGIYISTRISLTELKKQIPWVGDLVKEGRLIEASFSRFALSNHDKTLRAAHLSEFLEKLYNIVKSQADSSEPLILILDSVEAIKEYYDIPKDSLMLEKALIEIGINGKFNIIFVSETEASSPLDYLTDGIITLKMEIEEGMVLRTATITKLRGLKLKRPIQYFSITENGVVFLPPLKKLGFSYKDIPQEKTESNLFPTGIYGLTEALDGGYDRGSIVLLLIDENVPLYMVGYPNDMTAIQLMKLGIPWYYFSSYDYSGSRMRNLLKRDLPDVDLDLLFRPVSLKTYGSSTENTMSKVVFAIEEKDGVITTNETLAGLIKSDLNKIGAKTFYVTVGLNILDAYFDKKRIKKMVNNLNLLVREREALATYFLYSSTDFGSSFLEWVRYKLHFKIRDGIPLLCIAKPFRKGFYWLDIDPDRKEKVKLLRIT